MLIQYTLVDLHIHRSLPLTCINRKWDREILAFTSVGYIRAFFSPLQKPFIFSSSATARTSTSFPCQIQTDTIIHGKLIVTGMAPIYLSVSGLQFNLDPHKQVQNSSEDGSQREVLRAGYESVRSCFYPHELFPV